MRNAIFVIANEATQSTPGFMPAPAVRDSVAVLLARPEAWRLKCVAIEVFLTPIKPIGQIS